MKSFVDSFLDHVMRVVAYPVDPNNRIFALYLLSSLVIVFAIYLVKRRKSDEADGESSFVGCLFPKRVWSHPSAWLDVRYFFFHQFIGHFLMLGLFAGPAALACSWTIGEVSVHDPSAAQPLVRWKGTVVAFVYNVGIGMGSGAVAGLFFNMMGYAPSLPSLLGVPILMFLFNVVGYNLRHSHVWLRWPGVWSKVFPSPAHHHVHHSCHPNHLDKNFAFMFPLWDVLFGTYIMPEDNKDVKFGVTEKDRGNELDTCVNLYVNPFKDAWRLYRPKRQSTAETHAEEEINHHPAE